MTSSGQDVYYAGDFIDEGSFLVLTPGDLAEIRGGVTGNSQNDRSANNSISSQNSYNTPVASINSNASGTSNTMSSVPKPKPRSDIDVNRSTDGNQPIDEPISSYFQNSIGNRDMNNSAPNVESGASRVKSNVQHDVSLATVFSSISSVTSSEANSLEEAMELVSTLKNENEGLKEALAQRNESMRETLKSLHTSVEVVELKHADQVKKYEDCKKSIAELRTENERLKEELKDSDQAKHVSNDEFEKLETLESQLNTKEGEVNFLQQQIGEFANSIKELETKIVELKGQQNSKDDEVQLLQKQRDALQFELTDAKITIAKLIEEQKICKQEFEGMKEAAKRDEDGKSEKARATDSLEVALGQARVHLTKQKECIEEKDKVISSLQTRIATLIAENEQKTFCETQMREFESNFKDERSDKNKLAEELSLLKIELEKKTSELEKLHQTHLVLANEHLNRSSATSGTPSSSAPPEEFVFVARQSQTQQPQQNVGQRQEQVQTNPSNDASARSPLANLITRINTVPGQVQRQQQEPEGLQPCPMCQKRFATIEALSHHASNCGVAKLPRGTNPFIFP